MTPHHTFSMKYRQPASGVASQEHPKVVEEVTFEEKKPSRNNKTQKEKTGGGKYGEKIKKIN